MQADPDPRGTPLYDTAALRAVEACATPPGGDAFALMARAGLAAWRFFAASKAAERARQASAERHRLLASWGAADERELFAADGCHPNEEGSRIAAETIASVILEDAGRPDREWI